MKLHITCACTFTTQNSCRPHQRAHTPQPTAAAATATRTHQQRTSTTAAAGTTAATTTTADTTAAAAGTGTAAYSADNGHPTDKLASDKSGERSVSVPGETVTFVFAELQQVEEVLTDSEPGRSGSNMSLNSASNSSSSSKVSFLKAVEFTLALDAGG
jgi:hypothetical protein